MNRVPLILVTRPDGELDPLVPALRAEGYAVAAIPTVATQSAEPGGPLDEAIARLDEWDWVVVTSRAGVRAVADALARTGGPPVPTNGHTPSTDHARPRWAAVGPSTSAALESIGIRAEIVPSDASGRGVARALAAAGPLDGATILLPRADAASTDLPAALRASGATVHEVVAYHTLEGPEAERDRLADALRDPALAAIVVASGSAARGLVSLADDQSAANGLVDLPIISIGPSTAAGARSAGFRIIHEAAEPSVPGLVAAVNAAVGALVRPGGSPMTLVETARPREALATRPAPPSIPGRQRLRRLRTSPAMRQLVRETRLTPEQLVAPIFVVPGSGIREPIAAMPGQFRRSPDDALVLARELADSGVGGILLFGVPDHKDALGEGAAAADGPVPTALRLLLDADLPLVLIADVCLCEYTTHGHCGIIDGQQIDNDATLPYLTEAAITYATAGAEIVAPSAMMDGQVAHIRQGLDAAGFESTAILAYASKHASGLYGPFREAAGSAPSFGDRRSYQMDHANGREALREMDIDVAEGADMLLVKPAITSLDLLAEARRRFDLPLAAYQVSGEFAMLESAAAAGAIDRRRVAMELLEAIARAGADIVITYMALEVAGWLNGDGAKR